MAKRLVLWRDKYHVHMNKQFTTKTKEKLPEYKWVASAIVDLRQNSRGLCRGERIIIENMSMYVTPVGKGTSVW